MLSSAVLARHHSLFGFQLRSLGRAVCPPWTKRSSGGPSSWSSGVCSSPIWLMSQRLTRRSDDDDAKTVSEWGDQASWMTSSVCDSNEWSLAERLRRSQRPIVLSPEPVRSRFGDAGEKATALTSAVCASTACDGLTVESDRVSQLKEEGRQSEAGECEEGSESRRTSSAAGRRRTRQTGTPSRCARPRPGKESSVSERSPEQVVIG